MRKIIKEQLIKGPIALYEQMRQKVMDLIVERRLKPHDPVPSEGELAELFGVSRRTSKQALELLAKEGILYRLPRRGTFLAENAGDRLKDAVESNLSVVPQQAVAIVVPILDEFIGMVVTAFLQAGDSIGWEVLIRVTGGELEREDEILREMSIGGRVKGIVLFPGARKTCGQEVLRLHLDGFPVVIVDRVFREVDITAIYHDHYQGAYEMTKYLFDKGHRTVGFISEPISGIMSREDRYYGFIQAHLDAEIPIMIHSIISDWDIERNDSSKLSQFLEQNPDMTALFCSNDLVANKVMNMAEESGRHIPEHLSVVGFTDMMISRVSKVSLTTVMKSPEELGRKAFDLLIRKMASEDGRMESVKLPTQIIERGSVRQVIL
ncbi:substrate-binding domain-containing protein [Cohnella herbarum]|uniref:Substrate-binding domain-containing protein n=1 Tax=Cohnella herbarum TaxID=2728023 RepID=A0A7Z2VPL1_9BACL|nr:GntR family transcriptional regulator [Cohnella herbarum]QJD86807.1 substrate-binding domain-containing protein [Cohnella herbarum]